MRRCVQSGIARLVATELFQKWIARAVKSFLQSLRAIAVAADPRLRPVFVAAIAPRVRILHTEQLEIFLPIRTLFRERWIAEASFHPDRTSGIVHARFAHVV